MRIVVLRTLLVVKILLAGGVSYLSAAAAAGCSSCEPVVMLWTVLFLYAAAFAVVRFDASLTGKAGCHDRPDNALDNPSDSTM